MFKFDLKDLPFAALNLVVMPLRWMRTGFSALGIAQQAKVLWDALGRAGRKIEELQATNARLEKELTAWNVFGPNAQRVIEEFAIYKSDQKYAREFIGGLLAESPEHKQTRHDRAINLAMKQQIRNSYFVMPGNTFGTISQGAFALKDILRGPTKDFRTLVAEVEEEAELMYGSKEKYFKATQRAFIREFPERITAEHRAATHDP